MTSDYTPAIIGIGCRYPGNIATPDEFWKAVSKGSDCTSETPPDRFDVSYFYHPTPRTTGKMYNRRGGYLSADAHPVKAFDRQFFRMPRAEANHLDPQIRMLLEVTWEALEDAGIPPDSVRDSDAGVYVGVTSNEYNVFLSLPPTSINAYTNSGTNSCMPSNRISYEFDFHGPSYTIDTACSSSLYAVHQACEAVRRGECTMAVAGGANLLLLPTASVGFCQAQMLSPDGRCKSFDASADGYSRSEGAGVVLIKPLSKALEDNNPIYALVRGGALGNDGKTQGIAQPSYSAQVKLVEKACRNAGVEPEMVTYVEAHGTGTQVGDTTEAKALGNAMGKNRPISTPLYLGSVKSNIGHTEGAAGVAGIIKSVLTLTHKKIPPVANFKTPNPSVNFAELNVVVPSSLAPWPNSRESSDRKGSALVGCSSFGFGGANAHVILEESPKRRYDIRRDVEDASATASSNNAVNLLLLSASSSAALSDAAKAMKTFLDDLPKNVSASAFSNVCYTAAVRFQHHGRRLALIAGGVEEAKERLQDFLIGKATENVFSEESAASPIAFVFSGMGTQWWAMGRQLLEENGKFRSTIKKIDTILRELGAKWSLMSVLQSSREESNVNQTDIAQPCIFALEVALFEVLRECVKPTAILGHSVGEVAAAYAAGLLSLKEATAVIFLRGSLLRETSGCGKMLVVLGNKAQVLDSLPRHLFASESRKKINDLEEQMPSFGKFDVAAVNSSQQLVLSGDEDALTEACDLLEAKGMKCRFLRVNNAFHSFQQDRLKETFLARFPLFDTAENSDRPLVDMLSTVTGDYITRSEAATSAYWWSNIRQTVRFEDAVNVLLEKGDFHFVEIGAHCALTPIIRDIVNARSTSKSITLETLKRPKNIESPSVDETASMLRCLGKLHVLGHKIDFSSLFRSEKHEVVSLPHYPWQRVECWDCGKLAKEIFYHPFDGNHPLLGTRQTSFADISGLSDEGAVIWAGEYSAATLPWLKDHVIQGSVIFPAAAYIETCIQAGKELFDNTFSFYIKDVKFQKFMFAPNSSAVVRIVAEKVGRQDYEVTIYSQKNSQQTESKDKATQLPQEASLKWQNHAKMTLRSGGDQSSNTAISFEQCSKECSKIVSNAYEIISGESVGEGFAIGPSFQVCLFAALSEDSTAILLRIRAPNEISRDLHRYFVHPAVLDGCFQGYLFLLTLKTSAVNKESGWRVLRVPTSVEKFEMFGEVPSDLWLYLKEYQYANGQRCNVTAFRTDNHEIVFRLTGLTFSALAFSADDAEASPCFWKLNWIPRSLVDATKRPPNDIEAVRTVLVVSSRRQKSIVLQSLLQTIAQAGLAVEEVVLPTDKEIAQRISSRSDITDIFVPVFDCCDGDLFATTTADEFINVALSPLELMLKLSDEFGLKLLYKEDLRVWLLTTDAYDVDISDRINACQATVAAYLLTSAYEVGVNVTIVDFPSTISQENLGKTFLTHFCDNRLQENECAIRFDAESESYVTFFPRLVETERETFSSPDSDSDWSLIYSSKTKTVQRCCSRRRFAESGFVSVRTNSFSFVRDYKSCVDTDTNSSPCAWITGVVENATRTDDINVKNDVIGFSESVSKFVHVPNAHVVRIPKAIKHSEAALHDLVQEFFIIYALLTEVHAVGETDTVLVWAGDKISDAISVHNVARSLGADATVVHNKETISDALGGHEKEAISAIRLDKNFSTVKEMATVVVLLDDIAYSEADLLFSRAKLFASCIYSVRLCNQRLFLLETAVRASLQWIPLPSTRQLADGRQFKRALARFMQHICDPAGEALALKRIVPSGSLSELTTLPLSDQLGRSFFTETIAEELDLVMSEKCLFFAHPDESYLITGGLKGLGLSLAEWLVDRGAKRLHLVGRRAPCGDEEKRLDVLKQTSEIVIHLANVSDEDAVRSTFEQIVSFESTKLAGIFHCAAVYKDETLLSLNRDSVEKVLLPKAYGAWLLHKQSVAYNLNLRYFVLFSSSVSLFGNSGQCSYCTANIILNSIAAFRRKNGLAATAVQFGPIKDTGYLKEHVQVMNFLKSRGFGLLDSKVALDCMGSTMLLGSFQSLCVQARIDAAKYVLQISSLQNFSRLKGVASSANAFALDREKETLFSSSSPEKKQSIVRETLSDWVCNKVGLAEIPSDASLISVGFDSLMASEISTTIRLLFNVFVPPVRLLDDHCTLSLLVSDIVTQSDETNASKTAAPNQWLYSASDPGEKAICHLICFPPLAGGVSNYANWSAQLYKNNIALSVMQFPGWEGKEEESLLSDLNSFVELALTVVLPLARKSRIAFYGHSLGALIAYELALRLRQNHEISIYHFFVGAWYAPHLPYPHPKELLIPAAVFRKEVPYREMLHHVKNLAFLSPRLRSEFELDTTSSSLLMKWLPCFEIGIDIVKEYTPKENQVPCGIDAFFGSEDTFVKEEHSSKWSKQSADGFQLHKIDGEHQFTAGVQSSLTICAIIASAVVGVRQS